MVDTHDETMASLLRSVLSLGRRLRAERPKGGATLAALGILVTLDRLGPMPASRLADAERLQPQSLTRIVADLEARRWISRARSDADRRELLISLTPRGRSVLAADMRARQAWLKKAMAAALTEAERRTLFRASKAMLKLARHAGK
jgi:DNA-binding MarR family transcriptional regulator